jgi:hypothetical protein
MTETWSKDTHLCSICDALIEITRKDEFRNIWHCGGECILLSVEDATIKENPTERKNMLDNLENAIDSGYSNYNPSALVTYKKIAGTFAAPEAPEYVTEKVTDIEWALDRARRDSASVEKHFQQLRELEELLKELHDPNYTKEEALEQIAQLFGLELTKSISFSGMISFSGTVEVPFSESEDFDLFYHLQDNLTLDTNDGSIEIDTYEVDRADEE